MSPKELDALLAVAIKHRVSHLKLGELDCIIQLPATTNIQETTDGRPYTQGTQLQHPSFAPFQVRPEDES